MKVDEMSQYTDTTWNVKVDGSRTYQFTMINPLMMALKSIVESDHTKTVQITVESAKR